jgi:negative regulator of genetic competence, sporulation and motility
MKRIKKVRHVIGQYSNFNSKLIEAINEFQSDGLEVELLYSGEENYYSAVVIGYKKEERK